jgi:hypothetical protein
VLRKQFVHGIEIIAGLGVGAGGVVVEILGLVPGDDPVGVGRRRSFRQSHDSARDSAVVSKKLSRRALWPCHSFKAVQDGK